MQKKVYIHHQLSVESVVPANSHDVTDIPQYRIQELCPYPEKRINVDEFNSHTLVSL